MSRDQLDDLDYYTLLGVSDDASVDAIKSAFRSFARKYHPDRFADADDAKRERATRIFKRGSEAFQTLTDPPQRKAYDYALRQGKLRLTDDGRVDDKSVQRASAPTNAAAPAPAAAPAAPAPDSPIRTPEAQAYFKRAVDAAKAQDWVTAWRALSAANQVEPGNAFLETRFRQVDAMLRQGQGG